MVAFGEAALFKRCEELDADAIRGLFFMLFGGMTETSTWPVFYMLLSEMLPIFEDQSIPK